MEEETNFPFVETNKGMRSQTTIKISNPASPLPYQCQCSGVLAECLLCTSTLSVGSVKVVDFKQKVIHPAHTHSSPQACQHKDSQPILVKNIVFKLQSIAAC